MNQSFNQVFVTNSSALLPSGTTVDLAVGQIGIFDGRTYAATVTPTYFKNKSLVFGWGTPDLSYIAGGAGTQGILLSGIFNETEKSKEVKARLITGFRGHKAQRGQTQIVTVGNSGDITDTDNLFIKSEETKVLYVKLSGTPIDRLYSTQGLIRQYRVTGPCANDCTDTCGNIADNRFVAEQLANQINQDPKVAGLIKASVITQYIGTAPTDTPTTCYNFALTVCDNGDGTSLGLVQAQYPGSTITRIARSGSNSTYGVTLPTNSLPSAYSNAGLTIISDCPTCPSGYTLVASAFAYEVKRADAGTSGALTTLKTDYGIVSPELGSRVNYDNGVSTYVITSATVISAPVGVDQLAALGVTRNSCVITSPSTIAWVALPNTFSYGQVYNITLADSICGTNRLADLQAAYPNLTISVVNAGGSCVHTYTTTLQSQCVAAACSADARVFVAPQAFEGVSWTAIAVDPAIPNGTTVLVGVKLESAWVDRITNTCTYGYYPYNADGVHIQVSNFDPNYNGPSELCESNWVVKTIREYKYPQGFGAYVREQEEKSLGYYLKDYSYNALLREIEGFEFQSQPRSYYDEYVLSFKFEYLVGGFSVEYKDSYKLHFFFPEGTGAAFEAAINSYITSANIGLDPVVL